jgi:hypothetical protein
LPCPFDIIIIPHFEPFVKGFLKTFLSFFALAFRLQVGVSSLEDIYSIPQSKEKVNSFVKIILHKMYQVLVKKIVQSVQYPKFGSRVRPRAGKKPRGRPTLSVLYINRKWL